MPNIFDQFDEQKAGAINIRPVGEGQPTANVFDQFDAPAFKERFKGEPAPPKEDRGTIDAAARGVAQGATFNFGDELRGLMAAGGLNPDDPASMSALVRGATNYLSGDPEAAKRYALVKGQQSQLDETAAEQHPVANFTGNVAGGLTSAIVAPGAGALRAGTATQRFAGGLGAGAAYGGLAGVGSGDDLASRTTGGIVGGAVGGALGGTVNGLVGSRLPALGAATGQEVAEAANNIGVPIMRGAVSDNTTVQSFTQASKQLPLIGSHVADAMTRTSQGLEGAVDEAAQKLAGVTGGRAAVGTAARQSIEKGIDVAERRADSAFSQVRGAINPDKPVQLPATLVQDLDAIVQRRVAAGENGVPLQGLQSATELLTRPEGATFNGLQRARSEVGKAIKWDARNGGFITGDLKTAYGTLSDAMEAAVRDSARINPDVAVNMLNKANNLFGRVIGETKELTRFLSNGSDERIVDRIIGFGSDRAGRGDIAKLNLLRNSMDKSEWDSVAAAALQRMGMNSKNEFSTAFFVKNYQSMTPAAREMMFGKAGTNTRQWIDDIATVSRRMDDLSKTANFSNTARATLYGLGIYESGNLFTDPIGSAKTALTTVGVGLPLVALLARPASASSMAKWAKAYEMLVSKPSTAALASFNVASRNFAHTVGDVAGVKIDPGIFLKTLQGPATGRAQDNQPQVNGPPGQ